MQNPDSAVLIPIVIKDGKECILYEKRSDDIKVQPGDVCFPGGGIENGENPKETVIRETCEELLIEPENIEDLKFYMTTRGPYNRVVSVYTGRLCGYNYTFSKDESQAVFAVPIDEFRNIVSEPDGYVEYHYGDFRIWGFTARVTKAFLVDKSR